MVEVMEADLAWEIDRCFNRNGCKGLTIWPSTGGGFQGNVQNAQGGWQIGYGDTPSEAIREAMYSSVKGKRERADRKRRMGEQDLI